MASATPSTRRANSSRKPFRRCWRSTLLPSPPLWRSRISKVEPATVQRPAHFDSRVANDQCHGQFEPEGVKAAAEAGDGKIFTKPVRQHLADAVAADEDVR